MFELNENINQYRNELISKQSIAESDVEELLSHLKDEITGLIKKGLSEEESFWIARRRLGDAEALSMEFSKVNQTLIWQTRLVWLLLGFFLFTSIPKLVNLITIPIYLLNLKGLLISTPLLGPNYPVPIPIFLLIFFLSGGIFFLGSKKHILNNYKKHLPKTNTSMKISFKFLVPLLGFYVITNLCSLFSPLYISTYDFKRTGLISAASGVFEFFWILFLLISLIILAVSIFKKNRKKIIA